VGETIELIINADEADRADVWIDLNNNGKKDAGEAVTHFGNEYSTRTEFTLGAQTISIYGKVTELHCYDNRLTALDVSKNPSLTVLDCGDNHLTELDVSNNSRLAELWCEDNRLTSLDVSNNPKLVELWCEGNQLAVLDLSNNPKLIGLYCFWNQLTALDVSNNPKLTELYCWDNHLTTLDVSNNPKLTELYCWDNHLTTLDVSNNPKLTELECSFNQLTALNLSNNSELNELSCHENKIAGKKMTALVSSLPDRTGQGAGQLTVIDLSSSNEEQNEINDTQKAIAREKTGTFAKKSLSVSVSRSMICLAKAGEYDADVTCGMKRIIRTTRREKDFDRENIRNPALNTPT
jgi:hypothetical protein